MRRHLAALAVVLASAAAAFAQEADDASRLRFDTERVVVFKDGYCLVVRRGVARSNDAGEVFTEEVPDAAVLGSFWATPAEGRLLSMTAGVDDVSETTTETVACLEYLELLQANEGKPAVVQLDGGEEIRGTIRDVLTATREVPEQATNPYRGPWGQPAFPPPTVGTLQGSLFVISSDAGEVALPVSRIRGLTIREMEVSRERTTTTTSRRKRLTFRFEGGAAERTLHVMYFRPGVRWIPTYRLSLDGDEAEEGIASLRLQAEILNEAEDLVDVPFDLVVGVPSFKFKEIVSPFVLEQALTNALAQAAPQIMGQQLMNGGSNAFFSNRAGEWRGPSTGPGDASVAEIPVDIAADRSHDLFVYSLPAMTLRRGERASVPVFTSDVPYRDVYTWDLHLTRSDAEAAPAGRDTSPLTLSRNRVWHQLELRNSTDVPWTTGPCMLLDGLQPLGQDLLTYTASGGRVRVPVTVAIDIRGDAEEEETDRKMNAVTWGGYDYARIDKRARITITSFKQRDVDVEVICRLGGRAHAATHEGKIVVGAFQKDDWTQYHGHPAVNNHSEVRFALRLPAGEALSPEIEFHYFARH